MLDGDPALRNILIRGEISNFKSHFSGHCYFTLKDANSNIKSVMFKGKAQYLKFAPVNGMKVVAEGYVTVFERDGQYQLYVNSLFPEGVGELAVAFEQRKEKLTLEGLFDPLHKKTLPAFPRTIGVVTSATGAVLRDILKVAKRRNASVGIRLHPVLVQGDGAAEQIAAAIRFFNERYPVDALIVGRGGGSMEDLWCFNEEAVVRAIYASRIPIVSAVGHETDYTLADLAADVRAATPSQAAELTVPDARELLRQVGSLEARLTDMARRVLREKRGRLAALQECRALNAPQLALASKRQMLDYHAEKLEQLKNTAWTEKKHRLAMLMEKLQMLDPLAVVQRGYGIVRAEGKAVRKADDVKEGQSLELIVSGGRIDAVALKVRKERGKRAKRGKEESIV